MSKLCPFCKKRIKDEETCPHCHRVIIEKIEQTANRPKPYKSFHLYRGNLNKKTSDSLKKPFKITKEWVIGGLILLALVYFIPKLNTPTTTQQLGQETTPTKCTRTTPYSMLPEFERALSLISQRLSEYYPNSKPAEFRNCLNIQYADLKKFGDNAEGIFLLDKSVSNPNNLVVFVDTSYRSYDDLLTAILLVHEIIHAKRYYDFIVYGDSLKSCMEEEVIAFQGQFNFLKTLNAEERNSIFYRIGTIIDTGRSAVSMPSKELNQALVNLNQMITIFLDSAKYKCKMEPTCTLNLTAKGIRDMVENSPDYQKQCGT